jgi:WD40 repeat protein
MSLVAVSLAVGLIAIVGSVVVWKCTQQSRRPAKVAAAKPLSPPIVAPVAEKRPTTPPPTPAATQHGQIHVVPDAEVACMAATPDGRAVATVSRANRLYVILTPPPPQQQQDRKKKQQQNTVDFTVQADLRGTSCAVSASGQFLAAAFLDGRDGSVAVLAFDVMASIRAKEEHQAKVRAIERELEKRAKSRSRSAVGAPPMELGDVKLPPIGSVRNAHPKDARVVSMAFVGDGERSFATCGSTSTVMLWSVDGSALATVAVKQIGNNAMAASPDGRFFGCATVMEDTQVWEVSSKAAFDARKVMSINGHKRSIVGIAFGGESFPWFAATASMDQTIRLWRMSEWYAQAKALNPVWTASAKDGVKPVAVAVSRSPAPLVAVAYPDRVEVLGSKDGSPVCTVSQDAIVSLAWVTDGGLSLLLVCSTQKCIAWTLPQ